MPRICYFNVFKQRKIRLFKIPIIIIKIIINIYGQTNNYFAFFILSTTECGYNFCHILHSTQRLRHTTSHPVIICRNEVNLDKNTWISKTLTDETSWAADFSFSFSFSHYSSIHPWDSWDTKTFSSYSMSLLLGQLDSRHHADRSQRTGVRAQGLRSSGAGATLKPVSAESPASGSSELFPFHRPLVQWSHDPRFHHGHPLCSQRPSLSERDPEKHQQTLQTLTIDRQTEHRHRTLNIAI